MLELGILAVIILAAVYWMALWLMGRREDVLYGSFVSPPQGGTPEQAPEPGGGAALSAPWSSELPPPELPRRPRAAPTTGLLAGHPTPLQPKTLQPTSLQPTSLKPTALQPTTTASATPATADLPPAAVLASLLETIKRDLNDAAGNEPHNQPIK
ncbi:conserved hypothetical protein [Rhodopseudomonas palustris HaA2]|uniref:Uncharacterized protein n=1 Tax=Rhodopseudomonas palustris (strain HaA2) TaxID=316058 RepID=Q2J1Z1_RHOP2|nr:hypothetical protein [Rhodopseudomonas palustris]ABD05519.1 conserved hypothetical protein [Rhodopseudomonas palustris HaA2]